MSKSKRGLELALLERIKKPNDIKKIPQDSYEDLAAERAVIWPVIWVQWN